MITSNLHSIDRILRLIIGLFIVSLVFWGPKTLYAYAGIILIITVFINFCPLYAILGINTQSTKKK